MRGRTIVQIRRGTAETAGPYGGEIFFPPFIPLVIPRRGRAAACKIYLGANKDVPMYAMRGVYAQTVKYKPTWKE